MLFFEKKNQKTFAFALSPPDADCFSLRGANFFRLPWVGRRRSPRRGVRLGQGCKAPPAYGQDQARTFSARPDLESDVSPAGLLS
jgi:hypothetical protein